MAITTLSMVLTVFVLNLHHITDKPVPVWAKKFVFLYLGRMMGMCSIADAYKHSLKQRRPPAGFAKPNNSFYQRASSNVDGEGDERTAIIELHTRNAVGLKNDVERLSQTRENAFSDLNQVHQNDTDSEENKPDDFSKDWKRVAEVMDRLFFWLFLLAILISTLVLFHPITSAYFKGGQKAEIKLPQHSR